MRIPYNFAVEHKHKYIIKLRVCALLRDRGFQWKWWTVANPFVPKNKLLMVFPTIFFVDIVLLFLLYKQQFYKQIEFNDEMRRKRNIKLLPTIWVL